MSTVASRKKTPVAQVEGALASSTSDDVLMGHSSFREFVDEVAVQVSVVLLYVGLDDAYDVVADPEDPDSLTGLDLVGPCVESREQAVCFEDEEGTQLPVYVSCSADGIIVVAVARDDDSVEFVSPPRTLGQMDEILADVVAAIEREVPRTGLH